MTREAEVLGGGLEQWLLTFSLHQNHPQAVGEGLGLRLRGTDRRALSPELSFREFQVRLLICVSYKRPECARAVDPELHTENLVWEARWFSYTRPVDPCLHIRH